MKNRSDLEEKTQLLPSPQPNSTPTTRNSYMSTDNYDRTSPISPLVYPETHSDVLLEMMKFREMMISKQQLSLNEIEDYVDNLKKTIRRMEEERSSMVSKMDDLVRENERLGELDVNFSHVVNRSNKKFLLIIITVFVPFVLIPLVACIVLSVMGKTIFCGK